MSGPAEQQIAVTPVDGAAVGVTIATLAGWLPAIAALFTIIWTGIRIYETDTIQKMICRVQGKKYEPSPKDDDDD